MGKLYGTLSTPLITIAEGGILEGQCKMEGIHEKKEGFPLAAKEKDYPLSS
jgi:cytoskeletal protein CcmA (bactofilin family)